MHVNIFAYHKFKFLSFVNPLGLEVTTKPGTGLGPVFCFAKRVIFCFKKNVSLLFVCLFFLGLLVFNREIA